MCVCARSCFFFQSNHPLVVIAFALDYLCTCMFHNVPRGKKKDIFASCVYALFCHLTEEKKGPMCALGVGEGQKEKTGVSTFTCVWNLGAKSRNAGMYTHTTLSSLTLPYALAIPPKKINLPTHVYTTRPHTHTHINATPFVLQTLLKGNLGMLSSDMIHK